MKKNYTLAKVIVVYILMIVCSSKAFSQTNIFPKNGSAGIGTVTPNSSSLMEMISSTKGLLIPRMKKNQRDAIAAPAVGLLIFQTNDTVGFYYYSGIAWTPLTPASSWWSLTGNSGTIPSKNFIGTTDKVPLIFKTSDSERVRISKNGFMGIGTNTPQSSLDIVGTFKLTNGTQGTGKVLTSDSAGGTSWQTPLPVPWAVDGFNIYNTNENLVGIGTTTPAYKLDVLHSGSTGIRIKSSSSYSVLDIDAESGDAAIRFIANGVNQWNLRNRPADNYLELFELGGGGSRLVVQDGTGNVGIGETTNPVYKLDILHGGSTGERIKGSSSYSVLDIDAFTGDAAIRLINNGTGQWDIRNAPSVNDLQFFELGSGGLRMTIQDATGNVGIGTGTPTATLSVNGTADKPGGGSWAAFSDARLKQNVTEYKDGLNEIMKINPVKYHYNNESGFDTKPEYVGVVAQELQKVAPYMVKEIAFTKNNPSNTIEDKNSSTGFSSGNNKGAEKKTYLQVDNSAITYMLVNAVKEMKTTVDEKDAKIDDLQKQINDLKTLIVNMQQNYDKCSPCAAESFSTKKINSTDGGWLEQNIPNPAKGNTSIGYSLPQKFSSAQIIITDKNGKSLKSFTLSNPGAGKVYADAALFASGTYNYSLYIDGKIIATKQLVIAK